MKKLFIPLLFISSLSLAQSQKQYQPTEVDMQTPLSIRLDFTAIRFNNYSFVVNHGGPDAIMQMNTISALQASQLLSDYSKFRDSISSEANRVFTKWYKQKTDKWASDTLAVYKKIHTN